jgi:hypothetical protein
MLEENDMAALIIRLPDGKRERLKDLARARGQSVTKLFEEMATVMLAEYDAETRFRACARAARARPGGDCSFSRRRAASAGRVVAVDAGRMFADRRSAVRVHHA